MYRHTRLSNSLSKYCIRCLITSIRLTDAIQPFMAFPSPSSSSALLNLIVRILGYALVEDLVRVDNSYSTLVSGLKLDHKGIINHHSIPLHLQPRSHLTVLLLKNCWLTWSIECDCDLWYCTERSVHQGRHVQGLLIRYCLQSTVPAPLTNSLKEEMHRRCVWLDYILNNFICHQIGDYCHFRKRRTTLHHYVSNWKLY